MTQKSEHLFYNRYASQFPPCPSESYSCEIVSTEEHKKAGRPPYSGNGKTFSSPVENQGCLLGMPTIEYGVRASCCGVASEPLTDSPPFNLAHTVASPAMAANDTQGTPEESTEHYRRLALWSLPDSAVVRTTEAALMLTRSVRTLQNWRYRRVGPPYQLGSTVTYKLGDLRAYVDGCTTTARKLPKYG